MPLETKERIKPFIPELVYEKIATEKDAKTIPELKKFLLSRGHPVTSRWATDDKPGEPGIRQVQIFSGGDIPFTSGGVRIILKNAKITAEKVIIRPLKPNERRGGDPGE
jgi:acetyl-CoA decarbonylase/synthase complex subunit beta